MRLQILSEGNRTSSTMPRFRQLEFVIAASGVLRAAAVDSHIVAGRVALTASFKMGKSC